MYRILELLQVQTFHLLVTSLTHHRFGELLIDTNFDPVRQISHSVTIKRGVASNGIQYANFHLPSTKTKGLKGDNVRISDSTCSCSAYTALDHHMFANSAIPGDAPLFAFKTADGGWAPLKRTWFMNRCNTLWEKHG
jgi:hypothetical protein